MAEIREYAAARGIEPTTVVQNATNLGGLAWQGWLGGKVCTMPTAEAIRAYMADNPPATTNPPPVG